MLGYKYYRIKIIFRITVIGILVIWYWSFFIKMVYIILVNYYKYR